LLLRVPLHLGLNRIMLRENCGHPVISVFNLTFQLKILLFRAVCFKPKLLVDLD
jgi:hypothetical protein